MKRLFFLVAFLSILNTGKASHRMDKTSLIAVDFNKTFVGSINHKIDVVFNLKNINGKITGFYYYHKIGIEINLTGIIDNGELLLYELDDQNIKKAKITGKLLKNSFLGRWEDLSTKKNFPIQLEETNKSIPSLPKKLLGTYKFDTKTGCRLTLKISKIKGTYVYSFNSSVRTLKGKVTFSRSLDEKLVYINLNGIEWADNTGAISDGDLDAEPKETLNLPTSVGGLLSDGEITIQNSGNSMNAYLKIGECSAMYIQLKRIGG
ncbi:hypothetical protein AQ505_16050 [Pedobacter sp. PACM 27299]|uniref:hypothetical protein n=1 Tax=Pedobacter sp. PACM 27299 TaxID=1727164 RepID=UPI0007063617|nr:hypothetical protein [Pedobacter sp. PACM 27299]ALL06865.1 hypothetical protein AQ505_16050 [Pedobacter sp. PACM 27299]